MVGAAGSETVISDKMLAQLTEWNGKYVIILRRGLARPFQ